MDKMNVTAQLKIEKAIHSLAPQQLEEAVNFLDFLASRNMTKSGKNPTQENFLGNTGIPCTPLKNFPE
ncbi:MAG: hypothetical protein WAX69_08255 [Victivallales bacterium]